MELRGRKIGEEIGKEIGKEVGKEIGALENARDYIKMVLKTRLGDIPIEIEQAVDKISVLSILDELLKSALTVNSFEELRQFFEQWSQ
jgi:predicted hydrocarbon binding protein